MSLAIISTRLDVLNFIRKDFLDSPYDFKGELDFGTAINVLISVNDLPGVMGICKVTVDKIHDVRYNNESVSILADVTVPNSDMYINFMLIILDQCYHKVHKYHYIQHVIK